MVFKPYEAIFVVLRGVLFQGENVNVDSPKQKLRSNRNFAKKYEGGGLGEGRKIVLYGFEALRSDFCSNSRCIISRRKRKTSLK